MKVMYGQVMLADSQKTVVIEGNHYFPKSSIQMDKLEKSQTEYTCPWKGQATYWNATVRSKAIKDIAWSYDTPLQAAERIKEHLAFDKNKVEILD